MITTYFRSSSFNCHDMCPMQYYGEYILGWRGPANIKADKGTIVHKILEVVADAKKSIQDNKPEIVTNFGTFRLNKRYILSNKQIDDIIEKTFKWYATRITCHDWSDKDFTDCKNWAWKALEFRDGEFDPRKKDIVEVEARFDFEICEPWAHYSYEHEDDKIEGFLALKGTIDQITKVDDKVYEIVDWKTGRRLNWATGEEKTHEKLRDDPQLRIYHYAAHQLWPDVDQILMTIYYINDGGPFTICFTNEDLPKTEEMLRKKFEVIKSTIIPQKNISWKCRKLCHMGKSTFEDTHITPLINRQNGHVTRKGEIMSKCEQIDYIFQHRSPESVTKHMSAEGHKIDSYKPPGDVE